VARRRRVLIDRKSGGRRARLLHLPLLVAATGSCMPALADRAAAPAAPETVFAAAIVGADPLPIPPDMTDIAAFDTLLSGDQAAAANAALPIGGEVGPAAAPMAILAGSGLAPARALDCLAQAVYYEARSESEDGQRAVAQVVLNRVRHPSWPNSVCGVVYQGPMRAGGGCQFTFTCDGSLRFAPVGAGWARARRIAAEALAGRVFAPVGLATFYHTHAVMPRWAPRLTKVAVIGAHNFYRLPGTWGSPAAFSDRYAGVEPVARPNPILVQSGPAAAQLPEWARAVATSSPAPPLVAEAPPLPAPALAPADDSRIRPEYRQSGQWRTDAPAAITGR
jgi:spore germination cell wall hydrolase CwlJ-like protein